MPTGSSPLARGLLGSPPPRCRTPGIIPARAGFTRSTWTCCAPARDHPRSRGVYGHRRDRPAAGLGSSPLARGLPGRGRRHERERGIIPARAGFTENILHFISFRQDHPRSRGVYMVGSGTSTAQIGSSPLARGLPHIKALRTGEVRIIPARAGFTRCLMATT